MVVSCEEVWREISNYLDGEVDASLCAAMEDHLRGCKHCTAVLDGTRNVVQLYGDERMFEVPRSSVFSRPELRSEHAQPGAGGPTDMLVIVSGDGKTCHAAGCPFIHDKAHIQTIQAREALRQGYAPCVRCMKKYLTA